MIHRFLLLVALVANFFSSTVKATPRIHHLRYLSQAPRAEEDCSGASFHDFVWKVTDLIYYSSIVFSTPAHQIDGAEISFNLTNTATGPDFPLACRAYSSQLHDFFYGNMWYSCDMVETNSSAAAEALRGFNGTAARFRFNRPTGELVLNQAWTCEDRDPKFPVLFNATGTINTTLSCNSTKWQNANWTMGALYSSEGVNCAPATYNLTAFEITAVA